MPTCSGCGRPLDQGFLSCPHCGGTALPGAVARSAQPIYSPGATVLERFKVERLLGSGTSGVVYGVFDGLMKRRVALKVLWDRSSPQDPAFERFRREIRAAQSVQNPNAVAIYDLFFVDGHPALAMEWAEGGNLKEAIARRGPFAPGEAVKVASAVLSGLARLHEHGIVHRDVKSGNLLLSGDGTVKLGDFGLAKGGGLGTAMTEDGQTLGTPGYMAPEVLQGQEATPASDLYAVGVVLFEMLAGGVPFEGSSAFEVVGKQLSAPPPMARLKGQRVPRWLRTCTARLMEKDPADRFPSAEAALEALGRRSSGFALSRRWRWRAAAGAAVMAAVAAALWYASGVRAPLKLSFHEQVLEARSAGGRVLWTRTFPQAIQSAVEGPFGPDGQRLVACALRWDAAASNHFPGTRAVIMDRGGHELRSFSLGTGSTSFSNHYVAELTSRTMGASMGERLVAYIRHEMWYPTAVQVFSPQALVGGANDSGRYNLDFYNSGGLSGFTFKDLDGDGRAELICSGVNNRLYRMVFAASARVGLPGEPGQRGVASPDVSAGGEPQGLYYRLISAGPYSFFTFTAGPRDGPAQLREPGREPWLLGARDVEPRGPLDLAQVSRFNALLSNLCTLRDSGRFEDLLAAAGRLPACSDETYAWLGRLFRAQALLGLGNYEACAQAVEAPAGAGCSGEVPLAAWQFQLDSDFLRGDYAGCLRRLGRFSSDARSVRPEISHTALWAAIYSGDPGAGERLLDNPNLSFFTWYPALFRGIFAFAGGEYGVAEARLNAMKKDYDGTGDVDLWLARVLVAEGKKNEARAVYQRALSVFPGEDLGRSLVSLEVRAGAGSARLLPEADRLLASFRTEARSSVEARAVLPLEIAAAARLHRAAGDEAGARQLMAEARRLAPPGWDAAMEGSGERNNGDSQ